MDFQAISAEDIAGSNAIDTDPAAAEISVASHVVDRDQRRR